MPLAKNTPNGFYIFMQDERNRIRNESTSVPSMQDIAVQCAEAWKRLSPSEKERYDDMAQQEKVKIRNPPNRNKYRLDNQGQIIADRKNAMEEDLKRRTQEVQALMKSWEGQDILNIKFYVINFQVMYIEEPVDYYLPVEVGIVCFTLRGGISKHMHQFIDPGDAPQGNRHLALKHSEDTHKIPLRFEQASDDFAGLWNQFEKFIVEDPLGEEIPPIFCLRDHRKSMECCMDFIHFRSGVRGPNKFTKLYTLEDLVRSLIMQSGKSDQKPSEGQLKDSLLRNQWDYISSIRCSYHDELDCSYCSLAIVRRYSFSLFDMLSNLLDFKLTVHHMPDETTNTSFTVMRPTVYGKASDNDKGRARRIRPEGSKFSTPTMRSPTRSASVTSFSQHSSPGKVSGGAWGGPRVNRVEVKASDSENDSSSDTEALYSNEVRSTSELYNLKELRKPKAPAMVLPQSVSSIITDFGRGVTLPSSRPATPAVGIARRPDESKGGGEGPESTAKRMSFSGRGGRGVCRHTSPLRPPPGFGTVTSYASLLRSEDFPSHNIPSTQKAPLRSTPAALVLGWGTGRSRGMPPQLQPYQRPK